MKGSLESFINDMKIASSSTILTLRDLNTEQSKCSNCTVNSGQTWIFYKAGPTCLTQENVTQMTRVTRMTQPGFNPVLHISPSKGIRNEPFRLNNSSR